MGRASASRLERDAPPLFAAHVGVAGVIREEL
jgi:hypothetical protein